EGVTGCTGAYQQEPSSQDQATHRNPPLFQMVPGANPAVLTASAAPPANDNAGVQVPFNRPYVAPSLGASLMPAPPPVPGPYHSPHTRAPAWGASPKVTLLPVTLKSVPGCWMTPSTEINSSTGDEGETAGPPEARVSGKVVVVPLIGVKGASAWVCTREGAMAEAGARISIWMSVPASRGWRKVTVLVAGSKSQSPVPSTGAS